MFAGKAISLPQGCVSKICSTLIGTGPSHKHHN